MKKQTDIIEKLVKVIVVLGLIILLLIGCIGLVVTFSVGAWMHTYNAFTAKEKIAEIEVVSMGTDEDGYEKFELKYTQIQSESALTKFIFPNRDETTRLDPAVYQMYGDSFWVEAHVAKLPDFITLLNFRALYKITGIGGDYVEDKEKAVNAPSEKRSANDLNGGVDGAWKWIKDNDDRLQFIIDTAYFSRVGDSIPSSIKKWDVFITEEGIIVDSSN